MPRVHQDFRQPSRATPPCRRRSAERVRALIYIQMEAIKWGSSGHKSGSMALYGLVNSIRVTRITLLLTAFSFKRKYIHYAASSLLFIPVSSAPFFPPKFHRRPEKSPVGPPSLRFFANRDFYLTPKFRSQKRGAIGSMQIDAYLNP